MQHAFNKGAAECAFTLAFDTFFKGFEGFGAA
jgi:hypothetical protein